MIPSLLALALASTASTATSTEAAGLDRFRMPYEVLIDETIGVASKPVQFDWRRTTVHVAGFVAQPAEFNNYNAFRAGLVTRLPTEALMFELGLSYVWVWDTESSRQLALTPFRQPGRPRRFEIDFSVGVPLAEGVITAWPSFFPAVELVLNAYFNLRYLVYPGAFGGVRFRDVLVSLLSPEISDEEIENLDDKRLPAMEIDRQRYGIYAGLGTDLYFDFGLFVAPRVLFTVPVFAALVESKMTFGMEASIAIGAAF